jgi:hypothetical protein
MNRRVAVTLGVIAAIMIVYAPVAMPERGGMPDQVYAPQSPVDTRDRVHSPSDVNRELFRPACKLDTSLMDQGLTGKSPPSKRPWTNDPVAGSPPKIFDVGSFQCQS